MAAGVVTDRVAQSLRNAWLNGWTQATGLGLSLGISLLLARLAGPEALGLYSFTGGLAGVLIVVASLTINTIVARDAARDPATASEQLGHALMLGLFVSLPLGCLVAAVVGSWLHLDAATWRLLVVFAALNGVRNQRGIVFGALQGLSRFGAILVLEVLCLVATLGFGALALALSGSVMAFMLACFLVEFALLAAAIGFFVARVGRVRLTIDVGRWLGLAAAGLPVALTALANTLNLRADAVMLGLFRNHLEVGIYSAAFTAYLAVGMFLNSLSNGFFPAFSEVHVKAPGEFGRLLRLGAAIVGASALLLALATAAFGGAALRIVYGPQFEPARGPLLVLSLAVPFVGLQRFLGNALTAVGRARFGLYAAGLGAFSHVLANALLIPASGMNGAAVATVLGEAVACAAALAFTARASRERPLQATA